jgi:hypothetical protein
MHWTNHTKNSTYTPGFDTYRLISVPNKILGLYYDPMLGLHPYESLKKQWVIPEIDSHYSPIYHDLKDYHSKSGYLYQFTLNTNQLGEPANYYDAYSLATNYSIKNKIYKDSHGDALIPVTGVNPLSFPVIKNYTQEAHQFFSTRIITKFNIIPKMNNVKYIENTKINNNPLFRRFYR